MAVSNVTAGEHHHRQADEVAAEPEYAPAFSGWTRASYFATAEDTAARLRRTGFESVECGLEPHPVRPEDPLAYLTTIALRDHLARLPAARRGAFAERVVSLLPSPATVDYVRLNIDAARAGVKAGATAYTNIELAAP